ncbi:MAG: hypothetical protein WBM41_10270 [Arenicellales bacterium]
MNEGSTVPGRLLAIASLLCLLSFAFLAWLSHQDHSVDLSVFLSISLICTALAVLVVWQYSVQKRQIPFIWILCSAILFRAIGVTGQPLFADDFYRYLWDGYRTAVSGDPYSLPPSWFFAKEAVSTRFEHILSNINYPDIATVYGPVCQWIFAAAYFLSPGEIWPLQWFAALADIGILLLLRLMCRHNALLLYAWSPLLIKEFAFTAHPDILAVFMTMAAIQFRFLGRPALVGIFIGLACGIKIFALLLAPFLLVVRKDFKKSITGSVSFILTLVLITWWYGTLEVWAPAGLVEMADNWLFNAPLYLLLTTWMSLQSAKAILLISFALLYGIWLIQYYKRVGSTTGSSDDRELRYLPIRADYLYAVFLLCIPVLNPWYLAWVLPFAVLYPSRWAWTAGTAVFLAYVTGIYTGDPSLGLHQQPLTVIVIEFGAIGIALLVDWKRPLVSNHQRI